MTCCCILSSMQKAKGSEPTDQHSSSQPQQWSKEDRKKLTDLFALLLEIYIDQDVTKDGFNEDTNQ